MSRNNELIAQFVAFAARCGRCARISGPLLVDLAFEARGRGTATSVVPFPKELNSHCLRRCGIDIPRRARTRVRWRPSVSDQPQNLRTVAKAASPTAAVVPCTIARPFRPCIKMGPTDDLTSSIVANKSRSAPSIAAGFRARSTAHIECGLIN